MCTRQAHRTGDYHFIIGTDMAKVKSPDKVIRLESNGMDKVLGTCLFARPKFA